MFSSHHFAAGWLLLTAFAFLALAQEASIVGTVTDPSGAVVPNVSISITDLDTGFVHHTNSNNAGQYVLPDLHIGRHRLRAEAPGFKVLERDGIVLEVGDRTRVDVALEIGTREESVTVKADPISVQSDSGEVSEVISGQEVWQLATNGRSVYSLAVLTAGASSNMPDFQSPTAPGADRSLSFNGLRPDHNLWLADGAETVDRGSGGNMNILPSLDAIAEFRVLSSNYGAEYGLSSAGTMTVVFKSGTQQFHGGAWEFVRNEAFDATSYFTRQADKLRLNTFGFNLGGPVAIPRISKKRATFFFYNMEWRKLVQGNAINVKVPLPSTYGGVFPADTPIRVPQAWLAPSVMSRFAELGLEPGQRFPANTIPPSLLEPNAQILLKAGIFPAPNSGARLIEAPPSPTNVREELVRIDHQFSERVLIFGHWVSEQENQSTATPLFGPSFAVPTAGSRFESPSASSVIHAIHTIRPTLVNEAALSYSSNRIAILPTGTYQRPNGLNIPELFPDNSLNRMPGIVLWGSTRSAYHVGFSPWRNHFDSYQARDDLSWISGAHQLKIGGSWSTFRKAQDLTGATQGLFFFNGLYTGNDFADFLLGLAVQYDELAVQDTRQWNNVSWAAYVQDNWRVNRRLTLNLGMRWDGVPHTYEANNRVANFYPRLYDPSQAAILEPDGTISAGSPGLGTSPNPALNGLPFYLNGIGIAGRNGISKGLVENHWAALGPRIGFAYDLTGGGKTVLRGGFGAMYERIQGNDIYNAGPNQPFSASITFNTVSLSSPGTSLTTGEKLVAPIVVGNVSALARENYRLPVSYQYSMGIQRLLWREGLLSVAYVGNQNRHQNRMREINLPDRNVLPALIQNPGAYNSVVPYRGFGSILMSEMADNSHYNALQITLRGRLLDRLSVQAAYTWSRAMDPASSFLGDLSGVSNPYNRAYDYGPALVDRTHIGVVSFVYDVPLLRRSRSRIMRLALGGWQLSGIGLMQTGLPLDIGLGGPQGSNGLNVMSASNRPDRIGTISYPRTVAQWFNPAAFTAPEIGAWGNLETGAVRGPGRHNWNLAVFKNVGFRERASLELRIETFNTFNHVQFKDISSVYSDSNFGQVTSAWDPRVFQFGAKLRF